MLYKISQLFLGLVVVSLMLSCQAPVQESGEVELEFEMDLIPEGIAFDKKRNCIYLNSLKHQKIVSYNLTTGTHQTLIESGKYGYLPGFGMIVKEDTLYALGNSLQQDNKRSILLMLDLNSGDYIDSYTPTDANKMYLNDLVVSSDDIIYITDSESNKVFKIQRPHKAVEVFLDNEAVSHCNGISISADNSKLYLASEKGIGIIDIANRTILNQLHTDFTGNDGLKYKDGYLLGLVNIWQSDPSKNGIFKYSLSPAGDSITNKVKILSFDESFKIPTTFDHKGEEIFFIKNTQLGNLEEETRTILDEKKLEPYILMNMTIPKEK